MAISAIPSVPKAAPVSSKAQGEFEQLKSSLSHITSWELTPTDSVPIRANAKLDEKGARGFFNSISI
ncbi:MAG TPA: hypothetical protein PLO51_02915 [Candidatus Micrarchaeota archaeon]|nr:hypothetical protein [Candidatus Micrarchaeota archaeon]